MTPDTLAVDEITAFSDTKAMLQAAGCGAQLLATAHATDCCDLVARAVYAPLVENKVFQHFVVMKRDKSWHWEEVQS